MESREQCRLLLCAVREQGCTVCGSGNGWATVCDITVMIQNSPEQPSAGPGFPASAGFGVGEERPQLHS